MNEIDRQRAVVNRWLDGVQAGCEFSVFVADLQPEPEDAPYIEYIRRLQRMVVIDIVANGDHGTVSDPVIRKFLDQRTVRPSQEGGR